MPSPTLKSPPTLSTFTDEDSSFLRKLASSAAGPVIAEVPGKLHEVQIDHEASDYSEALRTAALLGAFDPLRLIPNADETKLKQLLDDCTVSTDGTSSRWTLRASIRARVLAEVVLRPDGLTQGSKEVKRYLDNSGEHADEVTRVLLKVLGGKPPNYADFAAMSKEVLAANRAVLGWLKFVDQKLGFDAKALLSDIEFAELLDPFRFLTGFDPTTGSDMFVGRSQELRKLRTFVDVLASEGILETVQRGSRRLVSNNRNMLFLCGVGGIGKSTLLAKFILQHVDTKGDARLRFAYLDFDRSTISSSQPSTLMLEILRQLGWEMPGVQNDLEKLRKRIRQEMERTKLKSKDGEFVPAPKSRYARAEQEDVLNLGDQGLPLELIGPSQMNSYLHEAGQILSREPNRSIPVLLVLDTFEEAQALGDQAVSRIESFIEAAQEYLHGLRVVLSGRDEGAGFFPNAERMVINEFSDAASRTVFLEKRGLKKQAADSVARQIGGRPLTLLLAARLVREEGLESVSVSVMDRFKGMFNKYLLDGILYQRILSHINDDDVRAMAHPGLVLRRIDAEILQRVIAPVLRLGEISDERARRILTALRHQKDLVRVESDGSVTHRADVREQMLALMSMEKPEMVRELHAAAAAYYASRQPVDRNTETRDRDRIEEIYHRLSIGESLERMPQLWYSKARLGLARSVDEITDIAGRGTLKVLLGRVPTAEELKALPEGILREYSTRSLQTAMAAQNPERALDILEEYAKLLPADLRRSIEPQVLDRSGQWVSAHGLFTELVNELGIKIVKEEGIEFPLSDALAAADFFERIPEGERQRETMARMLMDLGTRLSGRSDRDFWALPLKVATLRLKVRQGVYGNGRISLKEIDMDGSESLLPISKAPSTSQQWIMTLTDEIDRHGPQMIESMPVTDSVRGQLAYLKSFLMDEATQSDVAALGVKVCDSLSRGSIVGMQSQQLRIDSAGQSVVSLILRHLLRPPTPQWYVPIACLLRRELGRSVRTADLYDKSLPELPFKASTTLQTTKSLADFLGQLDQLGVLHICLQRFLTPPRRTTEAAIDEIVQAYLEWRHAMLFDVDAWFGSFEQVRLLAMTHNKTKGGYDSDSPI